VIAQSHKLFISTKNKHIKILGECKVKRLLAALSVVTALLSVDTLAQTQVKLLGARSQQCFTGGCFFEPNLTGEIQVANIAFQKKVDVVYDGLFAGGWSAKAASYQGPAANGYEIWDFSVADNVDDFAISYTVNNANYWDNNNSADYSPLNGARVSAVLGTGVDVLVGAKMQWNNAGFDPVASEVLVYIWTRDFNDTNASVNLTYTDDSWTTVKNANAVLDTTNSNNGVLMWSVRLPVAAFTAASKIQFAAKYQHNGIAVWDNNYNRNYRINNNNKITR